jgi:hypothetical protein
MRPLTIEEEETIRKSEAFIAPLTYSIYEWFIDMGFEELSTGGGCTAYFRTYGPQQINMLVTDDDGVDAPTHLGQDVIVGTYTFEGDLLGMCVMSLFDFMDLWR